MIMLNFEKTLFEYCVIFRNAIERTDKLRLPIISFRKFPVGSCGDAVLLLGHYLKNQGFGEFDYMLGELDYEINGQYLPHAWLQQENLIVDITGDQFEDFDDPVFVKSHSPWHEKFNGKAEHVADFYWFEKIDAHTFSNLNRGYFIILKQISEPA